MGKNDPYSREWIDTPNARLFKDLFGVGLESVHHIIQPHIHLPSDTRVLVVWEEMTRVAEQLQPHDIFRKRILMLRDMICMVCDEDGPYTKVLLHLVARLMERKSELLMSTGYAPTVKALQKKRR